MKSMLKLCRKCNQPQWAECICPPKTCRTCKIAKTLCQCKKLLKQEVEILSGSDPNRELPGRVARRKNGSTCVKCNRSKRACMCGYKEDVEYWAWIDRWLGLDDANLYHGEW